MPFSEPRVDGWTWDNHNRYWYGNRAINYSAAAEDCAKKGAILATVDDVQELGFYGRAAFNVSGYRPRTVLIGTQETDNSFWRSNRMVAEHWWCADEPLPINNSVPVILDVKIWGAACMRPLDLGTSQEAEGHICKIPRGSKSFLHHTH